MTESSTIVTRAPRETYEVARQLGERIKPPLLLGLVGEVGAGKTLFVQGLAKGLGYQERVVSPSYVLHHRYPLPQGSYLNHIDLYRLASGIEISALGLFEMPLLAEITVVEWADRLITRPPEMEILSFEGGGGVVVGESQRTLHLPPTLAQLWGFAS